MAQLKDLIVNGVSRFIGKAYGSFVGDLTGNASTATALTTSTAGSSTVPVYFSGGKPVQCSTTLGVSITGNADTLDSVHLNGIAAAKSTTLAWGTTSTIATIGGNNIQVTMPANPNTNTTNTVGATNKTGTKLFVVGTTSQTDGVQSYTNSSVYISTGNVLMGAAWNDYAEYRQSDEQEPGRVVLENNDGVLQKATERLQPFAGVVSDTFGFAEGLTDKATTPLAVAGRVLVYTYKDRNEYKVGDCVCAAPNGTVDIMTREEIINWPDRIVGTVSEIPKYEIWGENDIKVNNRIWIKVK